MSNSPTVAVCIPTCNQAQYLGLAIESALAQSYGVSEIWVANDRSDDDTEDVLWKLSKKDTRIKWFSNSVRLGVSGNVNAVLRKPGTDMIVRLDSDDRLDAGYVEEMVRLFIKYPQAGIFHCNTREVDRDGVKVRLRWRARSGEFQSGESTLREAPFRYGVTANICGFRRTMLEELGFTIGRPDYVEDYDLWVRAAAAGYGNVFSSRVLADYRVWADAKGARLKRKRTELEGLIRLFDEVLAPAYRARGWPGKSLAKGRWRHAIQHVPYFVEVNLTGEERGVIADLLNRLSGGDWRIRALAAVGRSPMRGMLVAEKSVRVGLWRMKLAIQRKLWTWREMMRLGGFAHARLGHGDDGGPIRESILDKVQTASVAVCIPTCNQAQYLRFAVLSALSQNYPVDEVWIANDASDDGTEEVLKTLSLQDQRIKFFTNPRRLGIAKNVDALLGRPKTDYIIRCDSDDCLHADYAGEMVRLFQKNPEAGVFHCNVREVDKNGLERCRRISARIRGFQSGVDAMHEAPFRYGVTANICGFRREALEKVGFVRDWPERAEDYHRWVQFARAGYGNVFSVKVLADYRVWMDAKGERLQRKSAELKGLIRIFEDALIPEYGARGWPVSVLTRARRKHALQQVPYLAEVKLTDEESRDIMELLRKLSADSPLINALVAIGRSPFRGILLVVKNVRIGLWHAKISLLRKLHLLSEMANSPPKTTP